MAKTRPPYPPEFRQKMIDLYRSGRTFLELANEFGVSDPTIRSWVKKADIETDPVLKVQAGDLKELQQLRKEVRILREERDILKKAAAWFAQETGTPSSRRSN